MFTDLLKMKTDIFEKKQFDAPFHIFLKIREKNSNKIQLLKKPM
jgi:hypothetical protein